MKKHIGIIAVIMMTTCFVFSVLADEASRDAYDKVLGEIKGLESKLARNSTMEQVMEVFGEVEQKLLGFVEGYPGTDEAQDAKFQLGILYSNIPKAEEAKKYLKDYIEYTPNAPEDQMGVAYLYLGKAHKTLEDFDKAEKIFKIVAEKYGTTNPRLLGEAKRDLDELRVLRRLSLGSPPIPFEVKGTKGEKISLDKYKGKVVLLDFWATWCGPCRVDMPQVIQLYKKYNKKGFEIIGISLDNNKLALDKYLKSNDMKLPQFFDGQGWKNKIAQDYGVKSIPATYLIDRKGKIRYKAVRGNQLIKAVEKLLAEK